jgi:hypothetical protein
VAHSHRQEHDVNVREAVKALEAWIVREKWSVCGCVRSMCRNDMNSVRVCVLVQYINTDTHTPTHTPKQPLARALTPTPTHSLARTIEGQQRIHRTGK